MTTTPITALRALRVHYRQPLVLTALLGVALVLGISGPFHTLIAFPLLPRLAYWATVVVLTYGAGYFISRLTHPRVQPLPAPLRIAATAFAIACAVTLILLLLNTAVGLAPKTPQEITSGFLAVLTICLVIESIGTVAHLTTPAPARLPAILDRLPPEKRGDLIALSVRDHYVDVITTRGRALLLMRLSDAIREAAGTPGLQIHRSHWVALDQISSVRRTGETATLTLPDRTELPVSRAGLKAMEDAGLLHARAGS